MQAQMCLNTNDFFECEQSHLQIVLTAPGLLATILKFRGKGEYKNQIVYAHDQPRFELLCPQVQESAPFNNDVFFNTNKALKDYLQKEVEELKISL